MGVRLALGALAMRERMGVAGIVAVIVAIAAVAIVLVFGLVNMMRGGSPNTSQKLMRLRVLLQFVAIIVIMVAVWVMKG